MVINRVIKQRLALFRPGLEFSGNDRNIHDAPPASFTNVGRLCNAMPKPAIVDRQVARLDIQSNFILICLIADKVQFSKQ